jgi:hypothetical protein
MADVAVAARPPVPDEAFEKYQNQWVAIRNGKVVAAADDFDQLVAHPAIEREDALYHVPSSATYYYY